MMKVEIGIYQKTKKKLKKSGEVDNQKGEQLALVKAVVALGVVAKTHNSPRLSPWKPWAVGGGEIPSARESRGRDGGGGQKP